jgi:hypothetical protein
VEQVLTFLILGPTAVALILVVGYLATVFAMLLVGGAQGAVTEFRRSVTPHGHTAGRIPALHH